METLKAWGRMVPMAGILSNVELNYQQIQRKDWRVQGRSMFGREQAVRAFKLVEGRLLEVRQEAVIKSQVFGLEAVDEAMAMMVELASWGTNVVIEPYQWA